MHSRKPFDPSSYWQTVVHLTDQEWSKLDPAGAWIDRSIRQWVYTNSHDGVNYFRSMEDIVHFWLAWGKQSSSSSDS